jgi:hypothetical protein
MAKNKVYIDIVVDDKGTTKKVAVNAKKLEKALEDTGRGAQTADRNLKGAAKASANGTKNFAKMSQGISGGLVPAYAALAAQIFALSAVFNFFKRAADLQNLEKSQISFAASTGTALSSITDRLREASGQMLGFQEAAEAAAIGTAKGFSSAQLESLAEGARKASTALGRSYQDTFDRLIRGVSKAEPELLDELGITLRLEKATKDYAAAVGKNVKNLTAAERSQAVLIETQRQLNDQFGEVEAAINPFVVMQKTFEDLIKQITQKVLPVFTSLAELISENAKVAIAAFAGLASLVLLNITGLKEGTFKIVSAIGGSFLSLGTTIGKSLGGAISKTTSNLLNKSEDMVVALERVEEQLKDTRAAAQKGLQSGAKGFVDAGSGSKILKRVADGGTLTGTDKANLRKALKAAEKQIENHGKVIRGIFQDASKDSLKAFKKSLKRMDRSTLSTSKKIKKFLGIGAVKSLKLVAIAARKVKRSMDSIKRSAKGVAKGIKLIGKATVVFAIIGTLQRMFDNLINAPFTLATNLINGIATIMRGFQGLLNFLVKGINKFFDSLPDVVKGILDIDTQDLISEFTFADNAVEKLSTTFENFTGLSLEGLRATEEMNLAIEAQKRRIEELRESYTSLGTQLGIITKGIANQNDEFKKSSQIIEAVTTTGIDSALSAALREGDPRERKGLLDKLRRELDRGGVRQLGEKFNAELDKAFKTENVEGLSVLITQFGVLKGNINSVNDVIANLGTQLSSSELFKTENILQNLVDTGEASQDLAEKLGLSVKVLEDINKVFSEFPGGTQAFLEELTKTRLELDRLKGVQNGLQESILASEILPAEVEKQRKLDIKYRQDLTTLQELETKLRIKNNTLVIAKSKGTPEEVQALKDQITALERSIVLQDKRTENAKRNASDIGQVLDNVSNSFESGMISAFDSIIQGTSSVKDAFRNMAISILQSLSQVIARMLAVKIIQAAIEGLTPSAQSLGQVSADGQKNRRNSF